MRRHVYYYTLIPASFDDVAERCSDDPAAWLPAGAVVRRDGRWEVVLRAEGALPRGLDSVAALITVGPAARHGSQIVRPVAWQSANAAVLFPTMEADLGLDDLDGNGSHVSLMGTYRPPMSVIGAAGDQMLGHRVAEACVRRFVLDIADRLMTVHDHT